MAHHSTTLVVDFDDTLAITHKRDWNNAAPNEPLIEKLNALYDDGWTIHIVTARGQLSCAGDCVAADKKYRYQIEEWLCEHSVKYHTLSFEKKLGAYYIDDKGITPEDFLEKFSRVQMKGGLSGAAVFYDRTIDAVLKTASNTLSVIDWYERAPKHIHTPEIFSVIGDTIKMELLFPFSGKLSDVLDLCYSFKDHEPLHVGLLPSAYVKRCSGRLLESPYSLKIDTNKLLDVLDYASANIKPTFSHGDFSISNIMSDCFGRDVYLIDPINDPTLLSSWIIDLAKLYMSIGFEFGDEDPRRKQIIKFASSNGVPADMIVSHEIGHLCRVFPYADDDKKELIIKKIQERISYVYR